MPASPGGQQSLAAGEPGTGAAQPPLGARVALAVPTYSTGDAAAHAGFPSCSRGFRSDLLYLQL